MKKKIIAVISIALVVLISGCLTPKPVKISSTDGLVINEFSTDQDRYYSHDSINAFIEVENVGGTTARGTVVNIIGVTWADINPCGPWDMPPPDLIVSPPIPGDRRVCSILIPPFTGLPEGVEFPIQLIARATYNYRSNGAAQLYVFSREFYALSLRENKPIPQEVNVSNSRGPIHIDVVPGITPLVVDSTTYEIPVSIVFKNVGSGVPIIIGGTRFDAGSTKGLARIDFASPGIASTDVIGKLGVRLILNGGSFKECGYLSGSGPTVSGTIELRKGESIRVPCIITVNRVPSTYDIISILFESDYGYYTEQPLTITIVGRGR